MSHETQYFYDFGEFRLDLAERVLLLDGKVVAVTPKVFETLQVLVENAGRIIGKDELMQKIWADRFVEDSNLTFNIGMLRKALGDDAVKPKYIETVPKRGYRFIAEVKPVEVEPETDLTDSVDKNFLPPEKKSGKFRLIFAGLLGVAILSGIIGYISYQLRAANQSPTIISASNAVRLTSSGNVVTAASRDGKFIAYITDSNGEQGLWLKNIAAGNAVQIPVSAEISNMSSLTFAPDGNHLYFGAKNGLYQIAVTGDTPKKILSDYQGFTTNAVSFSPDGNQIAFIRHLRIEGEETAAIIVADVRGGGERMIASSKRPDIFLRSATWSPDGEKIACAAMNEKGKQVVVVVRLSDGKILPVSSPVWSSVRQVLWQTDGKGFLLIVGDDSEFVPQIWTLSYPHGEARNITKDLNDYQNICLSADGASIIAVRAEQESHIWTISTEGGKVVRSKQITEGFEKFDGVFGIGWTTGGKIIYESAPSGKIEIWRIGADGRESRRLAEEGTASTVSPDGKYLVYQLCEADDCGLYRLNTNDGEKKRLTNGTDIDPAFSPDGRWIVFTRYANDTALWKVSIDGGEALKLTKSDIFPIYPTVSPDGKYIAFFQSTSSSSLAIINSDGGEIVKEFRPPLARFKGNGKLALQWTPDGRAITYTVFQNGVSNLWQQPFDGGAPVQITNFESGSIFNFAAASNGKQFALARGKYSRDIVLIKADTRP